jgi:hypothetical protein
MTDDEPDIRTDRDRGRSTPAPVFRMADFCKIAGFANSNPMKRRDLSTAGAPANVRKNPADRLFVSTDFAVLAKFEAGKTHASGCSLGPKV